MRHQSRSYALQALYQSEMLQSKSMLHCDRFLEQLETSDVTKQFARELIEGTLRFRKQIDRSLRRNLDSWKLNRLSFVVRNILRLAAFELCYHKQSSHQVVINEAIELCKDFVDDSSHGLVNSVLQKLHDEAQNPEKASSEDKKIPLLLLTQKTLSLWKRPPNKFALKVANLFSLLIFLHQMGLSV